MHATCVCCMLYAQLPPNCSCRPNVTDETVLPTLTLNTIITSAWATARHCGRHWGRTRTFTSSLHPGSRAYTYALMSECWLCITGKLKEGLEARSYRREIIFMYGTGNFALPLLQSWAAIDRQGFAHTIALMPEEKHCQKMLAFEPRFGCVWSTDTLPHAVR